MNKISLMLSALMMIALAILFMPGILALNHGKVLRSIALWLAIFTGLALIYKNFGPGSAHPLFSEPAIMQHGPEETHNHSTSGAKPADEKAGDSHGFTPPSE